ncbi:MAG TPA: PqqD family protein [Candidatus Sulfotelmatobacter sp.]|nr:PqqD family protein [Candidatus Sulfotelmatobacter sp.]
MSDPATIPDFTIAPGVRETASEDGAVLLDVEQGICFSLNPVGLRIWELLKRRCSLDQMADTLAQDFSVPRAQLLSDAAEFIEALETKRLIQRPGHATTKKTWFTRILSRLKERVLSA